MSDAGPDAAPRQPDPSLGGPAIDQSARAAEQPERIETEEEVVENLRRQMAELEARNAEREQQLQAERERAAAAERARREAEARAQEADRREAAARNEGQRSADAARLDAIANALSSRQGQMDALKAQYAAAAGEGEFSKAADIQAQMALIGAQIVQLESGKSELEDRIKAAATAPATPTSPATGAANQPVDPVAAREAWIDQQPPLLREWLRSPKGHRFFTDPDFQRRARAASDYAVSVRGFPAGTQEYIDFIDTELGLRQAPAQGGDRGGVSSAPAQSRGRDADAGSGRMYAAPVGGSVGGAERTTGGNDDRVYLTKAEKELAASMGVSEAEYAKHKRDLTREGLIGPHARG